MSIRAELMILAFSLACISSPARADQSALYEANISSPSEDDPSPEFYRDIDFGMTVEVNDAGDARIHVTGRDGYLLHKDGKAYLIYRGMDGPYAESLEDLDAALKARGEVGGISFNFLEHMKKDADIISTGGSRIGKWRGQGYAKKRIL